MSDSHGAECFICDESLNEGETLIVKERGVNRLRESSAKRKLTAHSAFLNNVKDVRVHTSCQVSYNNDKLIAAYLRKAASGPVPGPSRRSLSKCHFIFKDHCFLCGNGLLKDFLENQKKLPYARRNQVYLCTQLSMKEKILSLVNARGDQWAQEILQRISTLPEGTDLVAVDAAYHLSCYRKLYSRVPTGMKRGYRPASDVDEAMECIFSYLEDNSEECQFSFEDLLNQIEGEFRPDIRTIKARLRKQYGDDVLITDTHHQTSVLCFKKTGYKILSDNWYNERRKDLVEERLRILKAAADIIVEDIRSHVYDNSVYAPSVDYLRDVESAIPPSLLYFMESVVLKHKKGRLDGWKKKCVALSHSVISAVRPRSFVSSLLTGVGTYLYKKFGSRLLVNVLSSLGFSSSYDEVSRFELSAVLHPDASLKKNAFCQFIFDNADFNVNTLNGEGTFHAMGGIFSITPSTSVVLDQNINRVIKCSSEQYLSRIGPVEMRAFHKRKNCGLETITVQDIAQLHPLPNKTVLSPSDFIWLYGKWSDCVSLPGWNGFMEEATADRNFEVSKIICMPFINSPPSNYDTVLTSLLQAVEKCTAVEQKSCVVTFDQPLYLKARDIVSSGQEPILKEVIVRLGGFHTLMSFMGAVGFIMAGSGLKELLSNVYAENSLEKMMSGHAYARALRAHILVHRALSKLIFDAIQITPDESAVLNNMIYDNGVILSAPENPHFLSAISKFNEELERLEKSGSTAKLWVQYFRMITLMKQFVEAERMGNWQLHLDTVQKMIPYFHASGHFHYAKCAHLYLQDMLALQDKMEPIEFQKFTTEGYFTIRRSDKFWSGIWSDMTIEQTLMKNMKSSGGLTRGRGITDSLLTRWTMGLAALQNVCDEVENYCSCLSATTDQHIDMRRSRIRRDDSDATKLTDWFSNHNPFPNSPHLMSISSGLIGGEDVNCHLSWEIGSREICKIVNNNFGDVHFKRKNTVISLATITNHINTNKGKVVVDPLMLFHRMIISKQSDSDLKQYFEYELAPFPLSLFSEEGIRKGTKSTFYSAFTPLPNDTEMGESKVVVIDGGYLLHKVHWNRSESFSEIFKKYVTYVQRHHGKNAVIVFDGYPTEDNKRSTKGTERARRSRLQSCADVLFDDTMLPQMAKEKLLSNERNKSRFILLLQKEFEKAQIITKQATEDADVLIVQTAISLASEHDSVIVIGEDIDLLVLVTALAPENVYFCKSGRGNKADALYSKISFNYKDIAEHILFLHAISGCDTTSAPFGQGKLKFCTILQKNASHNESISSFKDPFAEKEKIAQATATFFVTLYGGDLNTSIDELRYLRFAKATTNTKFNLARLPPTRDAVQYHAYRTYLQVQTWMGYEKDPLNWGWKKEIGGLTPVSMYKEAAPQTLLKMISCQCKKACVGSKCSCKKAGLRCSVVCLQCGFESCGNAPEVDEYTEEDELDDLLSPGLRDELISSTIPEPKQRKLTYF